MTNPTDNPKQSLLNSLWSINATLNLVSEHAAETRRRTNLNRWWLVALTVVLGLHTFLLWSTLCS